MTALMQVYCDPRLKQIVSDAATNARLPLSEYIVRVLAKEFKRPDLAIVPRKPMGRPRKPVEA